MVDWIHPPILYVADEENCAAALHWVGKPV